MDLWPIILTASFKLLILKQDKQRINNLAEHREPGSSQGSLCNIPPQQLGKDLTPSCPAPWKLCPQEYAVSSQPAKIIQDVSLYGNKVILKDDFPLHCLI